MKRKIYRILLLCFLSSLVFACTTTKKTITEEDYKYTDNNIKYLDLREGSGPMPEIGKKVEIKLKLTDEKGNVIEDSFATGRTVSFTVRPIDSDKLEVIKGLQDGIMTMKQGGHRKLWVPPEMGFGSRSHTNFEPNSTLIIEVELLKVK